MESRLRAPGFSSRPPKGNVERSESLPPIVRERGPSLPPIAAERSTSFASGPASAGGRPGANSSASRAHSVGRSGSQPKLPVGGERGCSLPPLGRQVQSAPVVPTVSTPTDRSRADGSAARADRPSRLNNAEQRGASRTRDGCRGGGEVLQHKHHPGGDGLSSPSKGISDNANNHNGGARIVRSRASRNDSPRGNSSVDVSAGTALQSERNASKETMPSGPPPRERAARSERSERRGPPRPPPPSKLVDSANGYPVPPSEPQRPASPPVPAALGSRAGNAGGPGVVNTGGESPPEALDDEPLLECRHCSRKFRATIHKRHESICVKVFQRERKKFNALEHIVPEEALKLKAMEEKDQQRHKKKGGGKGAQEQPIAGQKVQAWRLRSEAFRNAIKQARVVQQYQKEGRSLRDLPPPLPPNPELDDRICCPHCGRKFGQQQAERHIPKCKDTKAKPTGIVRTTARPPPRPQPRAPAPGPRGRA